MEALVQAVQAQQEVQAVVDKVKLLQKQVVVELQDKVMQVVLV